MYQNEKVSDTALYVLKNIMGEELTLFERLEQSEMRSF
jgi:hypothetical protein